MIHTLVIGLGNPLMADDGAGIQVIELLRQEKLPAEVVLLDGGTAGVGLVPEMQGFERVIVVDCATMDLRPGEWRRFALHEARLLDSTAALSLHEASLAEAIRLAEALGVLPPEVIIYGIQPVCVDWDRPMTPAVTAALPAVARAVLDEVEYTQDQLQR